MKRPALPFEEINIRLWRPDSKEQLLKSCPSGLVPTLLNGDLAIWDSLAILDYLAEQHPNIEMWPRYRAARADARPVSAEMHSGFQALRENCSMELLARSPQSTLPPAVETDIRRIVAIWRDCRARFGLSGPFLFGQFAAADAMCAPVASRFRTYVADLTDYGDDGTARNYAEAIFATPEMAEWTEGARAEMAAAG